MKRSLYFFAMLLFAFVPAGLCASQTPGPPPDPTLHLFRESYEGGFLSVTGSHGVSREFIRRIRAQLQKDATSYAMGAYPNPGHSPAAARLRAGAGRIRVTYSDVPRGGEIALRTSDAHLVDALHSWMAATVQANQKLHHDGGPGTYPLNDRDD